MNNEPSNSGSILSQPASQAAAPPPAQTQSAAQSAPATSTVSWKDSLPEDLRNDPSLGVVHSVEALAKSYVSAQKMVGADKIVVPNKFATDQDWQQTFRKLGLPEDVSKYDVNVPETAKVDPNMVAGFKEIAHKAGILPKQAQAMFDWFQDASGKSMQQMESQRETATKVGIEGLQKEWGQAFDQKVRAAQAAVAEFGDPALSEFLETSGLGNHPMIVKLFAKVGETLSEDQIKGQADGKLGLTPADATQKINAVLSDHKHPYYIKEHPNHAEAVAEIQRLFQASTGA